MASSLPVNCFILSVTYSLSCSCMDCSPSWSLSSTSSTLSLISPIELSRVTTRSSKADNMSLERLAFLALPWVSTPSTSFDIFQRWLRTLARIPTVTDLEFSHAIRAALGSFSAQNA
ncbi:hypothetical protein V6Z12_D05G276600 [Gossypium hirsutum]